MDEYYTGAVIVAIIVILGGRLIWKAIKEGGKTGGIGSYSKNPQGDDKE